LSLAEVRLVDGGHPIHIQTPVGRSLFSPQRVDVGTVGGEARRHLRSLANGAVARDHDLDAAGGDTQSVKRGLVSAHLVVLARIQARDQDVGEHVAGEQDASVRQQEGGVADGVRLMLDDLTGRGSAAHGQRGDERDQFEVGEMVTEQPQLEARPALLGGPRLGSLIGAIFGLAYL
jgi:hypothetical protein